MYFIYFYINIFHTNIYNKNINYMIQNILFFLNIKNISIDKSI